MPLTLGGEVLTDHWRRQRLVDTHAFRRVDIDKGMRTPLSLSAMAASRTRLSWAELKVVILPLFAIVSQGTCGSHTSLSRSTSEFSARLYRQLSCGSHGNFVFSPLSLYVTLGMTLQGAGGLSKEELESLLAVADNQNIHAQLKVTVASLLAAPDVTINIANAVYYDPALLLMSDSYAHNISPFYGDTIRELRRPDPEREVNSWVNVSTRGAIPELLTSGDIKDDTAVLLMSAMFFEAQWSGAFYEEFIVEDNFTTLDGRTVSVSMMTRQDLYAVKALEPLKVRVLELPYKGERFSLFLLVPNADQELRALECALSGQLLEEAVTNMPRTRMYEIYVPKFEVKVRKDLVPDLKTLGLTSLFDPLRANFLPMMQFPVPGLLYVSLIKHAAQIQVTESGTRAAAATTIGMSARSLPQVMQVNRPFLFILRDKVERQNLFMGRVTDPSVTSK